MLYHVRYIYARYAISRYDFGECIACLNAAIYRAGAYTGCSLLRLPALAIYDIS